MLQQRVTLIEQLRKGQSAPVHVLDEISKSLPDRLWLTRHEADRRRLRDQRHDRVADRACPTSSPTWRRRAGSRSRSRSSTARCTGRQGGDLIKFPIKAQFVDPEAPPDRRRRRPAAAPRRGE